MKILFFSRGKGYGHAIPDIAVGAVLKQLNPRWEIVFASYASGARAFKEWGVECLPLDLPEDPAFLSAFFVAQQTIARIKPDLVVAHEEFAALPAAHSHGIPALFLGDWLPPKGTPQAESLAYASSVVLMEHPGIFPEPNTLTVRPVYTGPFVRRLGCSVQDRAKVRAELGLSRDELVVLATSGSSGRVPTGKLILSAFNRIPVPKKHLLMIAHADHAEVAALAAGRVDIRVFEFHREIEKLAVASDIIIAKNTRITLHEFASLGIPTISLSDGRNPVDEMLSSRIPNNTMLHLQALNEPALLHTIERILARRRSHPSPPAEYPDESLVATHLTREFSRLTRDPA